jgi:peptidoglycan/LPS O-acetylase OafA/YrhL
MNPYVFDKLPQLETTFSLVDMAPKDDGLLGNGYYNGIKPESETKFPSRTARWLDYVRPSIFTKSPQAVRKSQLRPTAYLDGLRGFAAFLVYWGHHQLWSRMVIHADKIFENGWGYQGNYYFACLPGIRTFFSGGHYSVTVFFVISGYVLSTKPLSLIHSGEYLKLLDNLASAVFRRWLRLHIPVMVVTFLYFSSWHAFGIWTDAVHESSWRAEVWKWYAEFKNFSFVFRTGGESWFTYDFHVWSIPVEMRGSIIIYTALLAFCRCSKNARLVCEVGLIIYFLYIVDGWFGSMFMSGMLLCDLDMLAAKDELPIFFSKLERFKTPIYHVLFIVSVYLGGIPSHTADLQTLRDTPGWYYLSFLKPQAVFDFKWFYLFWAATFLVAAIPRISWLKAFFESRFCQYMGRISFSFYLVHGPVLWILGDRLYTATGWGREANALGIPHWINAFPLSKQGPLGLEMSFLVPHLILLPVTLWLAEIVTRFIDEPSVKFSQWLYNKTMGPQEDQGLRLK